MPTSTIEPEEGNVIDFHKKRREIIIERIIEVNRMSREDIESIIKMHTFLSQVDYNIRYNLIDQETLDKIEDEIRVVREKFNELFEIVKKELFIGGRWRFKK
jgi:hypothetical protein